MKWYYVTINGQAKIIGHTKQIAPPFVKICEVDQGKYPAECYEIFHEEDGSCTGLLSERKLANYLSKKAADEYYGSK